jgi:hypothetical protein
MVRVRVRVRVRVSSARPTWNSAASEKGGGEGEGPALPGTGPAAPQREPPGDAMRENKKKRFM